MSRGRVVLVFPKVVPKRQGGDEWTLLPLSLLTIASPVLNAGYEVEIVDQRTDPDWRRTLADALSHDDVLCLGVSAMTGAPVRGALAASRVAREVAPDVPIVWGGVHASLVPGQTAASPLVDYIVVGEGEDAFLGLVRALDAADDPISQAGVYTQRAGRLVGTALAEPLDLEELPRPAYNLVDVERYLNAPFMTASRPLAFITSRGCPSRCTYCYNLAFNRRAWRALSPERVLDEIRHLVDTFSVDSLFLLDDNFFGSWRRASAVCEALVAEDLGVAFLNANCRVDTLDRRSADDLDLLRRAGFQKLFVGVESGCDEVLRRIQKDISVEQVKRVNLKLRDVGIVPVYSFMIGFPGEKAADMQATLRLMLDLVEDYPEAVVNAVNIFSPFPGTPLYEDAVRLGMPEPRSLEEWSDMDYVAVNYTAGFSDEELEFTRVASMLSDFIDPKPLAGQRGFGAAAKRAYARIARARVRGGFFRMMPEAGWLSRKRAATGHDTAMQ